MVKNLTQEVQGIVTQAKAKGHSVRLLSIAGIDYIYRSINREEFRKLQEALASEAEAAKLKADAAKRDAKDDPLKLDVINSQLEKEALEIRDRGEERLVSTGLLHPALTESTPAGVPNTIADRIMELSGFGVEAEPEIL